MNLNIVKVDFTFHWVDGREQYKTQHLFEHDIEWTAQQYMDVNGFVKVTAQVGDKTLTFTKD